MSDSAPESYKLKIRLPLQQPKQESNNANLATSFEPSKLTEVVQQSRQSDKQVVDQGENDGYCITMVNSHKVQQNHELEMQADDEPQNYRVAVMNPQVNQEENIDNVEQIDDKVDGNVDKRSDVQTNQKNGDENKAVEFETRGSASTEKTQAIVDNTDKNEENSQQNATLIDDMKADDVVANEHVSIQNDSSKAKEKGVYSNEDKSGTEESTNLTDNSQQKDDVVSVINELVEQTEKFCGQYDQQSRLGILGQLTAPKPVPASEVDKEYAECEKCLKWRLVDKTLLTQISRMNWECGKCQDPCDYCNEVQCKCQDHVHGRHVDSSYVVGGGRCPKGFERVVRFRNGSGQPWLLFKGSCPMCQKPSPNMDRKEKVIKFLEQHKFKCGAFKNVTVEDFDFHMDRKSILEHRQMQMFEKKLEQQSQVQTNFVPLSSANQLFTSAQAPGEGVGQSRNVTLMKSSKSIKLKRPSDVQQVSSLQQQLPQAKQPKYDTSFVPLKQPVLLPKQPVNPLQARFQFISPSMLQYASTVQVPPMVPSFVQAQPAPSMLSVVQKRQPQSQRQLQISQIEGEFSLASLGSQFLRGQPVIPQTCQNHVQQMDQQSKVEQQETQKALEIINLTDELMGIALQALHPQIYQLLQQHITKTNFTKAVKSAREQSKQIDEQLAEFMVNEKQQMQMMALYNPEGKLMWSKKDQDLQKKMFIVYKIVLQLVHKQQEQKKKESPTAKPTKETVKGTDNALPQNITNAEIHMQYINMPQQLPPDVQQMNPQMSAPTSPRLLDQLSIQGGTQGSAQFQPTNQQEDKKMLGKSKAEVASMISKYINDQFTNGGEEQQTFIKWCCRVLRVWKPDQTMQQAVQYTIKASKVFSHSQETIDFGVQCNLDEGVLNEYQTREDYLNMNFQMACDPYSDQQKPVNTQQNKKAPMKRRKKEGELVTPLGRKEQQSQELEVTKQGCRQGEDTKEVVNYVQGQNEDLDEMVNDSQQINSEWRANKDESNDESHLELKITEGETKSESEKTSAPHIPKIVLKRKQTSTSQEDEQGVPLVGQGVDNGFESMLHVDDMNQEDQGLVNGTVSEQKSFHQMDFIDMGML